MNLNKMQKKPLKVLHIITSLEHGGAQILATKLILERNNLVQHFVYVLVDKGPYGSILRNNGIEVISSKSSRSTFFIPTLFRWYLKNRPNIVHTWMYHADFIGLILSLIFKRHKLIWSLHHADPNENKFLTKVIITFCKFFSESIPSKIIACSMLASQNHIKYGYSKKNTIVINNGIDFEKFVNSRKLEDIYKFDKGKIVIGHIARWHSIKGHKIFLKMASDLYSSNDIFSFILVGTGIDWSNKELVDLLDAYNLLDAVQLLGEQEDINNVLNSLDIYVSSSFNESFSLTLIEAIACRVLSISTDTGIAREALSEDLCVVDIGDSNQLTKSVNLLISMPSDKIISIIDESYEKIHQKFDQRLMFNNYYELYYVLSNQNK